MTKRFFLLLLLVALPFSAVNAQPAPPSPKEFLGYSIGERYTPDNRIVDYFHALEQASPLIKVVQYGETYEHRPLIYAIVASKANMDRMEQVRQSMVALSDPISTSNARSREIAASSPAVAWLAFGVHGNETSSSEAAMMVAHQLLAGGQDVDAILRNTVVIIDPCQNPDGHDRYVNWYRQVRGETPDPNPDSLEQYQPWPGGRFNHYLIDMNRDWAISSQTETRARIAAFQQWYPQVFVDFHEMGYRSSYFFPPTAAPLNSNIGGDIMKWYQTFGKANAEAFSERGWPFFVNEEYDFFYPGYGDTWPALHGAIGMTYEVAGQRGLAIRRTDGTILTLADRADRHYTTAMTTLQTTSAHHQDLLLRSYDMLSDAVKNARDVFFLVSDSPNQEALVGTLRRQNVEVSMLTSPTRLRVTPIQGGQAELRELPAGTAVVSTKQRFSALVQTLLERTPALSKSFVEEQRRKIDTDNTDDFYDITAWSLPIAENVTAYVAQLPVDVRTSPWPEQTGTSELKPARYGYLIDGLDPDLYQAAGHMLRDRIGFSVSDTEFTQNDRLFHRGTLLIEKVNNEKTLDGRLQQVMKDTGATMVPVDSGWAGEIGLGSRHIQFVRDPKIAIAGGEGVDSTSLGMIWFTLDREVRIPHTILPLQRLRGTDLSEYRVLVFPDGGGYAEAFSGGALDKLKSWIRSGGTVVAVGEAAAFLRKKDIEISQVKKWEPEKKEGEKAPEERYNDFSIPGAAFRTTMNEQSYITFGCASSPAVLLQGSSALKPLSHAADNILLVARENSLVSGFAWPESLERVKGSAYVLREPVGDGSVITFADEPNYRMFWRGTLPLFLNSVLYSPSFAGS